MPLQNRVTPFGELAATAERGLVYGNRGCLHDDQGRIGRTYAGRRWIACRLRFRDWHRGPLLQPGRFTELFFLDEATALATGHRPTSLPRGGAEVLTPPSLLAVLARAGRDSFRSRIRLPPRVVTLAA